MLDFLNFVQWMLKVKIERRIYLHFSVLIENIGILSLPNFRTV